MRPSLPIATVLLLVPVGSWGQVGLGGPMPFGNGTQPQLRYSGAAAPSNLMSFGVSSEVGYDSNITNLGQQSVGGAFIALGPRIDLLRRSEHLVVGLDYYPYFLLYPGQELYDQFNQALSLDVSYRFGPRLTLQIRDSFRRLTGNFQPSVSNSPVPGLGPPTTLNQTIYTGFTPEQENAVRVDAIYRKSTRTSFTLLGAYDWLHFIGQPASGQRLYDTQATSGGFQYAYRLSERTTLGLLYLYQNFNYENSQSLLGVQSRLATHSALASFAWQLAPSVALSVFGGPQYVPSQEYFIQSPTAGSGTLVNPLFHSQWNWSAGGTLTKQAEKTAFNLTAGRMVTNGGGVFTAATNSWVGIGASRKLKRRWDAGFNVTLARTDNLNLPSLPRNQINSESATVSLDHPLGEMLVARLAYTYINQSNGGLVPLAASFNRNRVSLSFSYQAKSIPLGR